MVLSGKERQARYLHRLKERAALSPEAVAATLRAWVEEFGSAWDDLQPEPDGAWRDYIGKAKTVVEAIGRLDELAQAAKAETDPQRLVFSRIRLVLDALALREPG